MGCASDLLQGEAAPINAPPPQDVLNYRRKVGIGVALGPLVVPIKLSTLVGVLRQLRGEGGVRGI